jgi:hypothetical protein
VSLDLGTVGQEWGSVLGLVGNEWKEDQLSPCLGSVLGTVNVMYVVLMMRAVLRQTWNPFELLPSGSSDRLARFRLTRPRTRCMVVTYGRIHLVEFLPIFSVTSALWIRGSAPRQGSCKTC